MTGHPDGKAETATISRAEYPFLRTAAEVLGVDIADLV